MLSRSRALCSWFCASAECQGSSGSPLLSFIKAWPRRHHADHCMLMLSMMQPKNAATTKLFKLAIHRFNTKFMLHKSAPKAELTADDFIQVNMGCEITTAAPPASQARTSPGCSGRKVILFLKLAQPNLRRITKGTSTMRSLVVDLAKESQQPKKKRTIPWDNTRFHG